MYNIPVETVRLINQTKTPDIALDIKFFQPSNYQAVPEMMVPNFYFDLLIRSCLRSNTVRGHYIDVVAGHQLSLQPCSRRRDLHMRGG